MQIQYFDLPIKALKSSERPSVNVLHVQKNGTLLCGLSFCRPLLFQLKPHADKLSLQEIIDLKLESLVGEDAEVILNGLRPSTTGATALSVLHPSKRLAFFKGDSLLNKKGEEIFSYLINNEGQSSIVQILEGGSLHLRSSKEGGALLDVAQIGDFIFGLSSGNVWREPYLNPEKREILRKDLHANFGLHRDDEGTIWLLREDDTILRMGQMDIKANPSRLKLPKSGASERGFWKSQLSENDNWLYGLGRDPRQLFRIRLNPVSREEEFQSVYTADRPITSICIKELEKKSVLYFSVESEVDAELFKIEFDAAADPELIGDIPRVEKVGNFVGVSAVGTMSFDSEGHLWAGEGYLGWGRSGHGLPRIMLCQHLA